jgi:hypothetical protein
MQVEIVTDGRLVDIVAEGLRRRRPSCRDGSARHDRDPVRKDSTTHRRRCAVLSFRPKVTENADRTEGPCLCSISTAWWIDLRMGVREARRCPAHRCRRALDADQRPTGSPRDGRRLERQSPTSIWLRGQSTVCWPHVAANGGYVIPSYVLTRDIAPPASFIPIELHDSRPNQLQSREPLRSNENLSNRVRGILIRSGGTSAAKRRRQNARKLRRISVATMTNSEMNAVSPLRATIAFSQACA